MDEALRSLRVDIASAEALENGLKGKGSFLKTGNQKLCGGKETKEGKDGKAGKSKTGGKVACTRGQETGPRDVGTILEECIDACKATRKRIRENAGPAEDLSDHRLSQLTRFTEGMALDPYKQFLHYVPRLVNIVTVVLRTPNATWRLNNTTMTQVTGSRWNSMQAHPFHPWSVVPCVPSLFRSWPKPYLCQAPDSACPWTWGTLRPGVRGPFTRPGALLQFRWF